MVTGINNTNNNDDCVVASSSTSTSTSTKKLSDRRSNKPQMEKKRRARINNCLNELKTLILDAMKKDPSRHSKLEKADILELTVRHLQSLRHTTTATSSSPAEKFRNGFEECVQQVSQFPGLATDVRRRLVTHLMRVMDNSSNNNYKPQIEQNTIVHLLPTRLSNGDIALVLPNEFTTTTSFVPPSDRQPLALVVQQQPQQQQQQRDDDDDGKPWRPW